MHEREKWKWSHSVVSDSSRPHGLQPTRLLHPWDFPGKSGVPLPSPSSSLDMSICRVFKYVLIFILYWSIVGLQGCAVIQLHAYMYLLLLFSHWVVSNSFATPWTVVYKAALSMGFPRQDYWSKLPYSSPGDFLEPGTETASPAMAGLFFPAQLPGKPLHVSVLFFKFLSQLFLLFSHSVVSDSLDPVDCCMPGFPVFHYLMEFARTHAHWVSVVIEPSSSVAPFSLCPQSFPASVYFPTSWLFTSGGQTIGDLASPQSFQWIFRTDFL